MSKENIGHALTFRQGYNELEGHSVLLMHFDFVDLIAL
jgi:hypothetical protein